MTNPIKHSRPRRILALVALLVGAALTVAGCTSASSGKPSSASGASSRSSSDASTTPTTASSSSTAPAAKPVHVSLNISDNTTVGVGMPIIATFKVKVTNGKAFEDATKVTVNGAPASGAWDFEYSDPASGHVMEAHYRLQAYWPAHAKIHMDLAVKGLSAGAGLAFDDDLTLDFATGAANIGVVDDSTHTLTITSDGQPWGKFQVSLGANDTPTRSGTKVIMEKGASICMSGPGYNECGVKYTQRLTYDGEYLHAAPWNVYNITHGVDSSNGCTNLQTADALKLYNFLQIGDVVQYPNANGGKMRFGDGYGDWNVPWALWTSGGVVSTTA